MILGLTALVFCAGGLAAVSSRAAPRILDVPATVAFPECRADQKIDQTKPFLDWFNANVKPGDTVRFVRNGCYWFNNVIYINNQHDITFDGNNSTFKTFSAGFDNRPLEPSLDRVWPRLRAMWRLERGYNLILKNLTIIGSNGGPNAATDPRTGQPFVWGYHCPSVTPPNHFCTEGQAGVMLMAVNWENRGSFGAKLSNVHVKHVFGDGFEIFGYGGTQRSRGIDIRSSSSDRNGRISVTAAAVDDSAVENNTFTNSRRSILDIEPPTPGHGVKNFSFSNNSIRDDDGAFYLFANGGNTDAVVENITIAGNRLDNHKADAYINMTEIHRVGSRQPSRRNIKFINNISNLVHGAPFTNQAPIQAAATIGLEVRGNTQPIQPNQRVHAVTVYQGSQNVTVTGNRFANALSALMNNPDFKPNSNLTVCNNIIGLDNHIDKVCPPPPTNQPGSKPTPAPTSPSGQAGSTSSSSTQTTKPNQATRPNQDTMTDGALDQLGEVIAKLPLVNRVEKAIDWLAGGRHWLKVLLGTLLILVGLIQLAVIIIIIVIRFKHRRLNQSNQLAATGRL